MLRKSTAFLLIALTAGLVACGGSGSDDDETRAVEDVILGSTLSHDPVDCERYYTQDFLEQMSFGYEGEAAVRLCEKVAAEELGRYPRDATVAEIQIDGEEATAEASFVGGTIGNQTLLFALVKEGERWKIDRMVEFVEFDRNRLLAGLEREIEDAAEVGLEPDVATCVADRFEELDDDELQDLMLYQDPKGVPGIVEECLREIAGKQDL